VAAHPLADAHGGASPSSPHGDALQRILQRWRVL
jgi:hypothetical protein